MSVTFDRPFYVKPIDEGTTVIVGGKSPEQIENDRQEGVARFGGEWRAPDYAQAYLQAAELVVSRASEQGMLDELGLPAFHLQRHTVELILKGLLGLAYGALDCHDEPREPISKSARKRLNEGHTLSVLLEDLRNAARKLGLRDPPASLCALIRRIETYEKANTWSRYARSQVRDEVVVDHVAKESVVPIVHLQMLLAQTVHDTSYPPHGEGYGCDVYEEWASVARLTGRLG